jgi:Domain of unknown function (DUF4349)
MRYLVSTLLLFSCVLLSACQKNEQDAISGSSMPAAAAVAMDASAESMSEPMLPPEPSIGQEPKPGSFLAYEHQVTLRIGRDDMIKQMSLVRQACTSEKFGPCTILGEQQSAGDYPSGNLQMRLAPKAVDLIVKEAALGAEISERSTTAEDLADAVADNEIRQRRLKLQYAKMTELLERKDVKTEDLIAITRELAVMEADMEAANKESAMQRRRIETNLLTINFQSIGFDSSSSRIKDAISDFVGTLDSSVAGLIYFIAAAIPFVVFFTLMFYTLRFIWRRWRRNKKVS